MNDEMMPEEPQEEPQLATQMPAPVPGEEGKRVLHSLKLSQYQSKLLLMAKTAQTPEIAAEQLSHEDEATRGNLVGAKQQLLKMGLIEATPNSITVTPKGVQVMKDEFLIDDSEQPTEEKGKPILDQAQQKEPTSPPPTPGQEAPAGPGPAAPEGGGGEMETSDAGMPAEGSIFKMIHDLSKLLKG